MLTYTTRCPLAEFTKTHTLTNAASRIILSESGKHFDPRLVKVFLEVESEFAQIATNCADSSHEAHSDGNTSLDSGEDAALIDEDLTELDSVLSELEAHLEATTG